MRTFAQVVAAFVVLTVAVGAQQKPQTSPKPTSSPKPTASPKSRPNFSGRWTVVSPKDHEGQVEIVTQDAKTLTTEPATDGDDHKHKMTYQLDGVERRFTIPGHPDYTWLAAAQWEGNHIVITSKMSYPNGMKTQSIETWSIDEKGQRVIDFTESVATGGGETKKYVYVKK